MKEYTFTVSNPKYSFNDYSPCFRFKESWEGKIRIESSTENCIVATVSAECTRFDISLVRYYRSKDGDHSYCFTITNWNAEGGKGFGGLLARNNGYSVYNDDQLHRGIENPVDRLSATYAVGKLIEIFEDKKIEKIRRVDELFRCIGKTLDTYNKRYFWDETYGIICNNREDADEIANVFDDMYDTGTCEVGTFYDKYFVRNF